MIYRTKVQDEAVRLVVLPRRTRENHEAWLAFTRSDAILGLDCETSAIEDAAPFDPKMETRLVQFGNKTEAWVLDPHGPWRKDIIALLANQFVRFVSHNAAFDATRVLYEFHIDLGDRSIDTLPMACLRWPGRTKARGLKPQSDWYIDPNLSLADHRLHARMVDDYYAQTVKLPKKWNDPSYTQTCRAPKCSEPPDPRSKCGRCTEHFFNRKGNKTIDTWGWSNIDLHDPDFLKYAGLDAIYVRRLLDILAAELKEWGMAELGRREQKIKRYMVNVSRKGHRVDVEWTESVKREIEDEWKDAAARIEDITGAPTPRSKGVRDYLAREGVNASSLAKDLLPELIANSDGDARAVLMDLLICSERTNLLNNLRVILRHAHRFGGYVHPQINTLQAHTGRMSVTAPAMQTFKKTDKRLRGCFIARDGHQLIGADYDSQEIRIAAALSRDPMLLKIVNEGLNQHILTAESLFADVWIGKEQNPEEYKASKILDFAQQYGAGPKKIAWQLEVEYQAARAMWEKWRETYAGLVEWSNQQSRMSHVINPFGRVIPRDRYRSYANSNYLIQSSGRDVLGMALEELAENGWEPYFWLPVHDEMILEVPDSLVDKGIEALSEHMSFQFGDIPIPAEGELIGTRWGGGK